MDNPLLKYSAKEYFFKASLCHFIVDELNAKVCYVTLAFILTLLFMLCVLSLRSFFYLVFKFKTVIEMFLFIL